MKHGFSLLELSIVLVIIGLLAGGVMVGQDLVRQSEIRSILADHQKYLTAFNAFRNKYSALPGDMRNATAYWGVADATAACSSTSTGDQRTCNGDGDGLVEVCCATASNEQFRFWQHMVNAGLVEGQYTGIGGTGGNNHALPGINVPSGKITSSGWTASNYGVYAGDSGKFSLLYGNYFLFGVRDNNGAAHQPIIRASEAFSIDQKIDDGLPAYGKVIAGNWATCSDATSFSDLDSVYNLANQSTTACSLYFIRL